MTPELEKNLHNPPQEKSIFFPLLAVVGVLTISFFMSVLFTDNQSGREAVAIDGSGDAISIQQRATIDAQFMTYSAQLQTVNIGDPTVQQAILGAPYYTNDQSEKLLHMAQEEDLRIGMLTLWDNFDQDGDVIQISTEGVTLSVGLTHAPQSFYVPFKPSSTILITGVRDGGGGITAALATSSGSVPLPIMAIGQTIVIPHF